MDKITIEKLRVFACHGVLEEEQKNGQFFLVSADLFLDAEPAALADDLSKTVDYGAVCLFIKERMETHPFRLIETAAHFLAQEILLAYPAIQKINLRLHKPDAPIGLPFETVYIQVEKGWHNVFLSVGSNLGDRESAIQTALWKLRALPDVQVLKQSDLIQTKPYGYQEQGDFLNGCVFLKTIKTPRALLRTLNQIEADLGVNRSTKIHWGPRAIDLDILLYDQLILDEETLTIPHKDMKNRSFVLEPLSQIAGYVRHPVFHKTIGELWQELQGCADQAGGSNG
ncbi:MAG: 2-amino-4-hydroxy-6-hydroxymethyldihydropteridine diphosphokinase [Oscillospiraceae bacterium]|nr:2-amino-4-hydroxy-6-hydroxymethyldihydropteridine diphosphokinase [Oscillospiraceae bacterium]